MVKIKISIEEDGEEAGSASFDANELSKCSTKFEVERKIAWTFWQLMKAADDAITE